MLKKTICVTLFVLCLVAVLHAQSLSEKANHFLETLDADLKSKAFFAFDDSERYNMNYVPIERKGVTFHDFNDGQKTAALNLLKASLSQQGFEKTAEIRALENVLFMIENNTTDLPQGKTHRDPLNYHFWVFGPPSPSGFWGWKFEGHHISFNFTSTHGKIISSTPSFFGSNPGIVSSGPQKGKEVLKIETDLGFKLINSLSPTQLKTARVSETAPREIMTSNQRRIELLKPEGIAYGALDAQQKKTFMKLLDVYMDNYEKNFAKSFRDKIQKAGIDKLSFAWAGALKPGIGAYYRIQGPVLLIEYDNTQDHANHVHTVVRDLTNDYGEDILKEHYERDHKK